ncbi:MAG: hypothetical protein RLZZ387_5428 [Chloroflexota bacterium]|jgi:signal transduction histidine kinase/CheY-like chemotaxis protein
MNADETTSRDELIREVRELRARLGSFEADSARLLEAQKLESLGVLAGGFAHDFNNLLMAVLGNTDMARAQLGEGHPALVNVQQIGLAARRAADLTSQLLAYAGKGRFIVQEMDLNTLIVEMAYLLKASTLHAASPTYVLAARLPAIEADVAQIRQVVMNLISNAAEAIGERPGAIQVATEARRVDAAFLAQCTLGEGLPPGEYVTLAITDTGAGMDATTQARIFEPFFTTRFTGRGLGLAAVHGIVRAHRGALHVRTAPSQGTTVTVLLPALEGARGAAETHPQARETGGNASAQAQPLERHETQEAPHLALLIDDDSSVRDVTRVMLQMLGYTVIEAHDGEEGIELFRGRSPELSCVLLDLVMPGMRGDAVLAELRRIDDRVPVLLMSGYNVAEINKRMEGRGVAGFIQKPFMFDELRAVMALIL